LMAADPGPALSDEEAECILIKVDEYFEKACGGMGDNLKLRAPGLRGSGLTPAPLPPPPAGIL